MKKIHHLRYKTPFCHFWPRRVLTPTIWTTPFECMSRGRPALSVKHRGPQIFARKSRLFLY
uniref:Uncharacterized protein n=1 Tax=Lepeophtheirus salmonis TaxID=72036 RepID=A0A0K2U3X4_LEPSM